MKLHGHHFDCLSYSVLDESLSSLEAKAAQVEAASEPTTRPSTSKNIPDPDAVTYTDYENPFSLFEGSSGAPGIAKLSRNSWVGQVLMKLLFLATTERYSSFF